MRFEKGRSPRFTPNQIWFTPSYLSKVTGISIKLVEKMLESGEYVRAANIRSDKGEPVYTLRAVWGGKISFWGKVSSVLCNKVLG